MLQTDAEQLSLIANDIKVLVGQLNEALRHGAERGLKIEITISETLEIKPVIYSQTLSVKLLREVS